MKFFTSFLILLMLVTSCKSDKSESEELNSIIIEEPSIAEKIAKAHGYDQWKNVQSIDFTFQVDTDTKKGNERIWKWNPNTNEVTFTKDNETKSYLRSNMDSTMLAADRAFINDKYWLLIPFQLVWDTSASISDPIKAKSPIRDLPMHKVTLTYPPDGGGYTPGDAYDIYYDDSFRIREWIFRRGNAEEPTMSTTFESYRDYNGIILALEHKMPENGWNLNFTNVNVTFK